MKDSMKEISNIEDQEQAQIFSLLSENLITAQPPKSMLDSLEKKLENRIRNSIANHSGLQTIRARDGIWYELTSGIRYKSLWESQEGNSVLIEFSPGSALPMHRHKFLEEGIVLSGGLELDELELSQFDYHVSTTGSRHGRIRSKHGALAYLRGTSIGQPMSMFTEVLGGFFPTASLNESESVRMNADDWIEIHEGVYVKELWTDGITMSRFCRFEVGACMEGHDHPLYEECMMLSGDIFLGDILLQAGDYQIASAGSKHLDIYSDTGALLFVRGAI